MEKTGFGQIVQQGSIEEVLEAIPKAEKMSVPNGLSAYLDQKERFTEYQQLYEELLQEKEDKWKK